jgi:putative ABC transport system permease protein
MTPTLGLALRSIWNRRTTALLTISAIAISVALLLGVQKLRTAAKDGFANTVSGVDLIVGARSGQLNLLLYSVFRVGDATANVSWGSYQKIARHPDVAWTIPISLGDSYRGYRVMGTSNDYFDHYHFAGTRELRFEAGGRFSDLYDAVLGADVARQLGLKLGDPIVIAHGLGNVSFANHDDKPFRVAGILGRTGTPVDRTVHVGLEAITAIHVDWQSGVQAPRGARVGADQARAMDLTPDSITAFMIGMRSKVMTFTMQRAINEYRQEPLMAIIPGVALTQLWDLVGIADTALMIVAGFVVLAGLLGMLTAILTSLNERRREMAILRSVGAQPRHVFTLLVAEAGTLATCGVLAGIALTYATMAAARPVLEQRFGIFLEIGGLTRYDLGLLGAIIGAAFLMGALPAWRAYRNTLSDGLTIRV